MIIISAHSDTNYKRVDLEIEGDCYKGLLDNYVGVFVAMKAFFSGEINYDYVRIELTPDEEIDMRGAKLVAKEVTKEDLVIVVDVTGTETDKDFVIENANRQRSENFWEIFLTDSVMIFMKNVLILFLTWMKLMFTNTGLIIIFSLDFLVTAVIIIFL